jgi:hypothetical protein
MIDIFRNEIIMTLSISASRKRSHYWPLYSAPSYTFSTLELVPSSFIAFILNDFYQLHWLSAMASRQMMEDREIPSFCITAVNIGALT